MKKLLPLILTILMISCEKKADIASASIPLEGSWELLSETKIEKDDTTFTPASKTLPMVKIINKTHFAFLRHDVNQGKDSTALFVAGGGHYDLKGHEYTEHLEYCNSREWENHDFQFTVNIKDDTLIQTGREKIEGLDIDRIIIEKYKRVQK